MRQASKNAMMLLAVTAVAAVASFARPGEALVQSDHWWKAYGGDVGSSQYSPLRQINRENVSTIEEAWSLPLGLESTRANPLVVDGILYLATDVALYAVDAATGKLLWRTEVPGLRLRGIVHWVSPDASQQRILYSVQNKILALDARSGRPIDDFSIDLRQGLSRPPEEVLRGDNQTPGRVFEDLLIVGVAPGEEWGSPPGNVRAFDLRTGKLRWTFHTVPEPGEFGYETNPPDGWKRIGGNNNWGEMTLDVENGIVFVPLGSPTYDFWGANRLGNNLFGNSIVALDARTGQRRWHFQTVHHDLWDYDVVVAPKLLTLMRNGKRIQAVAQATKTGFVYTFDRRTGRPVFPIIEKPVPQSDVEGEVASPTQPFPSAPPPFAKQKYTVEDINPDLPADERAAIAQKLRGYRNEGLFTPPSRRGTIAMPGNQGGAQYGSVAADAARGRLYVVGINSPALLLLESPADAARRMREAMAGLMGGASTQSAAYAEKCAACHMPDRSGQPPAVPSLIGIESRMSAADFTALMQTGRGRMPRVELSPAEHSSLLKFLGFNALVGKRPQAAQETASSSAVSRPPKSKAEEVSLQSAYNLLVTKYGTGENAPPWSTMTAYDMNRGTILWQVPFGANGGRGAGKGDVGDIMARGLLVATAGGLLVASGQGGWLNIWDSENGDLLLRRRLPSDANGMPAVYSVAGRQFIAVPVAGQPSYSDMMAGKISRDGHGSVIAFALPSPRKH